MPRALPVLALPAASANMTIAVMAVQMIPAGLGSAWCLAAKASPD